MKPADGGHCQVLAGGGAADCVLGDKKPLCISVAECQKTHKRAVSCKSIPSPRASLQSGAITSRSAFSASPRNARSHLGVKRRIFFSRYINKNLFGVTQKAAIDKTTIAGRLFFSYHFRKVWALIREQTLMSAGSVF